MNMSTWTNEDYSFDDWWRATHPDDSTSVRIKERIDAQVQAAQKQRQWNQPLIGELLVPWDLSKSTFVLPAVEERLKEFLPLAESVNEDLAPQLNWAPTGRPLQKWRGRLSAVETPADGNCLLHAVSLCLWGQHDPGSVLRSLLRSVFEDERSGKRMFDIWKDGQERADAAALGMTSFEMEQNQAVAEWKRLVEAAKGLSTYLSPFHAFVLANILGRPIVILADAFLRGSNGEAYAPSDMRGIYLPTLKSASACYPTPIVIGYTCAAVGKVGHFTALVGVAGERGDIPLVDEDGVSLPVRYGVPPATRQTPRPEESLAALYVRARLFYTAGGAKCLMALVHEVSMAPEAEQASKTLACKAKDKCDWGRREKDTPPAGGGPARAGTGLFGRSDSTFFVACDKVPLAGTGTGEKTASANGSGGWINFRRIAQYLLSTSLAALAPVVSWATGSRWLVDRRSSGRGFERSSESIGSVAAKKHSVSSLPPTLSSPGLGSPPPTLSSPGAVHAGFVDGERAAGSGGVQMGGNQTFSPKQKLDGTLRDELETLGVKNFRTIEYTTSPGLGFPPPVSGAVRGGFVGVGRAGGSGGVRMSGNQIFSPKRKLEDTLSDKLETLGVKRPRTIKYTSSPGLGSPTPASGAQTYTREWLSGHEEWL